MFFNAVPRSALILVLIDLDSEQIYIINFEKENFKAEILNYNFTFSYGVDTCTCYFRDVPKANTLTK